MDLAISRSRRAALGPRAIIVAGCLLAGALAYAYAPCSADDAYIVLRYAERLVDRHELSFNDGDRVSALTSPLHALVTALLYLVTRHSVVANKAFAAACTAFTLGVGLWSLRGRPAVAALFTTLLITSPFILLWTFGGLETAYVLAEITALTMVLRATGDEPLSREREVLVYLLVGLAAMTRYDTVVYTLPVSLFVLARSRSRGATVVAALPGVALVVAWFVFARVYFHDFLPTSLHVKAPPLDPRLLFGNAVYLAQASVLTGSVAFAPALIKAARAEGGRLRALVLGRWGIYAGVVCVLLYAILAITTHVMYGCRLIVPYFPSLFFALLDLADTAPEPTRGRASHDPVPAKVTAVMLGLQAILGYVVYARGMNPFYRYGEFHRLSVVDCIGMGDLLTSSAGAVREHWSRQPESARRPPRVDTFAGGILPYYLPEAYVFETLVSYRAHCATSVGWSRPSPTAAAADYIYAITPGIGTVEEQLPRPRSHYNLVLTRTIASNGAESTLYVFHDPEPLPNPLPRYVDQPCLVTAPAATPQVD